MKKDYIKIKKVKRDVKKTSPYIDKYEYTRLIAVRAQQISQGIGELSKPKIETDVVDPISIAKMELSQRVFPLILVRTLFDGTKEEWNPNEMNIRDY